MDGEAKSDDFGVLPEPPQWALDAGLPAPQEGEGFSQYVTRLGFDADDLLDELTERTAPLANGRLASALRKAMPDVWDSYVDTLDIPYERRAEIEDMARNLFGESFRRRIRPGM